MTSRKRRYRVVIGHTAARELDEALDDLDRRSAGGARTVLDAIDACLLRLSRFPESSAVDPSAPAALLKRGTKGRRTHAAGFSIRYAFPMPIEDDAEVVLILSIRHGRRRPLDDREFLKRFLTELIHRRSPGSA